MDQSTLPTPGGQTCGACGTGFVCGIQAGRSSCWCFELPRVCRVAADADCWCPECLAAEIARQQSREMTGCRDSVTQQ